MKHLLVLAIASCAFAACGPSEHDLFLTSVPMTETAEADLLNRQSQFSTCRDTISKEAQQLEEAAGACNQDYDCRAKVALQIQDLADELATTCTPAGSFQAENKTCEINLIKARAAYIHGAPLETTDRREAEEYLADQVKQAYEDCFALFEDPLFLGP